MPKTQEKTEAGSTIHRGFSFAGCVGTEYNLMERLTNKGYFQLYCEASYYWGMFNPVEFKIFTYTEGDTCLIECGNKEQFLKELDSQLEWFKQSGNDESHSDMLYAMKKYKVVEVV